MRTLCSLAAAAALIAAGCGSNDDDGNAGGSGEQFGQQVNAVCDDAKDELQAVQEQANTIDPTTPEAIPYERRFAVALRGIADDVEALQAPADERDAQQKFLEVFREGADKLDQLADAVESVDVSTAQQLKGELNILGTELEGAAKDIGAPSCANSDT